MLQMNSLNTIRFNITDYIRRKYIWHELCDYEEYIKREQKALEEAPSELSKQMIILNISAAYYEMGDYNKAIETIRILDNYELNDNMTFAYYLNSLMYYIFNNEEENADYIYEESEGVMKKFFEKHPDTVDIYNISYLNFKGRYDESLEILNLNRIKNKDADYIKLLLADIAFNTDQFDEGCFIISDMYSEYNKKIPCIRKQIDTLINMYMRKVPIEKDEFQEPISSTKKLWDKVKDSKGKTSLFFVYLSLKRICSKKIVQYAVIPALITKFLCSIFFPLIYGKIYSEVFTSIISFLFLAYFAIGLGYIIKKYITDIRNKVLPILFTLVIAINTIGSFFISDFTGNVLDLRYVIFKNPAKYRGIIEKVNHYEKIKRSTIELKITDKTFIIYDCDYLYPYINDNFKRGQSVDIEYLPHTKKIINIENTSKKS